MEMTEREKQVEEEMNQAFSVSHVKSEMLTRYPKGDVQETVEHTGMTLRRREVKNVRICRSLA